MDYWRGGVHVELEPGRPGHKLRRLLGGGRPAEDFRKGESAESGDRTDYDDQESAIDAFEKCDYLEDRQSSDRRDRNCDVLDFGKPVRHH